MNCKCGTTIAETERIGTHFRDPVDATAFNYIVAGKCPSCGLRNIETELPLGYVPPSTPVRIDYGQELWGHEDLT